jgi:hypothetical protein
MSMQRVAAILMILCYAALGSGALEYWHNAQHAEEDAVLMQAAHDAGAPLDHAPIHDESNCAIHGQLHLAGLAVAWTPLLICLGLFVAFLSLLAPRLTAQGVAFAIPCRGPPIQ